MKKILVLFSLLSVSLFSNAQESLKRIPEDAVLVASFNGNNVLKLMSISELDRSVLGQTVLSKLSTMDSDSSLADFGIDLNSSAHYFMQENDSITYHSFIIPLSDDSKWEKLLTETAKKEIRIEEEFHTVEDAPDGGAIFWDKKNLVFVMGILNESYLQNDKVSERYGIKVVENPLYVWNMEDTWEDEEYDEEEGYTEVGEYEEEDVEYQIQAAPMDTEEISEMEEVEEEEVPEPIEVIDDEGYYEEVVDTTGYDVNLQEYNEYLIKKEVLTSGWSLKKAKAILRSDGKNSIFGNAQYIKYVDKEAALSFWMSDMSTLMQGMMSSYGAMLPVYKQFEKLYAMYEGNSFIFNLYLNKKDVTVKGISIMNEQFTELYKKILNKKMNPRFANYINEDKNIGYFGYAVNTAEMLRAYPEFLKKNFSEYAGSESGLIEVGCETLSIMLDEDAIGKVLSGDVLFLFNDISQKEVTYTTYDYDENFEYKEVEERKMETVPDFMLLFSSENTSIFNKLITYGIEKEMVIENEGYYEILIPDMPIQVFVAIKDGIVFAGTSEMDMMQIVKGTYQAKISDEHKKMLLGNKMFAYFNSSLLSDKFPVEEMGVKEMQQVLYLLDNLGDFTLHTSKMKGNVVTTEVKWAFPEGHENSMKYFFDLIQNMPK